MENTAKKPSRRNFLSVTAYAMGVIGVGAAGWALIDYMNPAADTFEKTLTYVDLRSIKPGKRVTVVWRRQPVFIYRRTEEDIRQIRAEDWHSLRVPQSDESRVHKGHDEWLLVIGVCTHLGCVLMGNKEGQLQGRWDGWLCPCCSSSFDRSGRVRNGPAPKNLYVPDYYFDTDSDLIIGAKPATGIY